MMTRYRDVASIKERIALMRIASYNTRLKKIKRDPVSLSNHRLTQYQDLQKSI